MKLLVACAVMLAVPASAIAEVEEFHETFRGTGEYATLPRMFTLEGLDNPDWEYRGNGVLTSEGFRFENVPGPPDFFEEDVFTRDLEGVGSFIERLVVRDLMLAEITRDNSHAGSFIEFGHFLDTEFPNEEDGIEWQLEDTDDIEAPHWSFWAESGTREFRSEVPRGENILVEVQYDHLASTVTYLYDSDIDDQVEPLVLDVLDFTGEFTSPHSLSLGTFSNTSGDTKGIIESYSIMPFSPLAGDFNADEQLDVSDVDILQRGIRTQSQNLLFDLNDDTIVDTIVDTDDLTFWIHELKNTYFGDANLDGEFNSVDLITTFQAGQYEDSIEGNSTWATGDWNADGEFTSGDLVVAFQDGGYEQGPRASVSSAPEPSAALLLLLGMITALWRRGQRRN